MQQATKSLELAEVERSKARNDRLWNFFILTFALFVLLDWKHHRIYLNLFFNIMLITVVITNWNRFGILGRSAVASLFWIAGFIVVNSLPSRKNVATPEPSDACLVLLMILLIIFTGIGMWAWNWYSRVQGIKINKKLQSL
jgi:hypothetical protein